MAKKKKYYVVWNGVTPGIYDSWADCQLQIKGYPGAKYKAFSSQAEANAAFEGDYSEVVHSNKKTKAVVDQLSLRDNPDIVWESISVDAACSGNPGKMEYQGVDTRDGSPYFHQKFELGTNNIGEFLAIVHALAMLKKTSSSLPIYTDSKIAMGWIRQKKCRTKLVRNAKTKKLHEVIGRAEKWLTEHTYPNTILKWNTEEWGEIPADFGRK